MELKFRTDLLVLHGHNKPGPYIWNAGMVDSEWRQILVYNSRLQILLETENGGRKHFVPSIIVVKCLAINGA